MTLQVTLPEPLAAEARELAERENTTLEALIATALAAQLERSRLPTIAERAARVNWQAVDAILSRVPAATPLPGDEV